MEKQAPWGIIYDSIFVCKVGVYAGSSTTLQVLISLAASRSSNTLIGQKQNSPLWFERFLLLSLIVGILRCSRHFSEYE